MEACALVLFALALFTTCQAETYEVFDNAQTTNNISTHVLDVGNGYPGENVSVYAFFLENGNFISIGNTTTNSVGRVDIVHPNVTLRSGIYKLKFNTGDYYALHNQTTFFPSPELVFSISDVYVHYHVPLTLSRYGYTTYKGA